MDINMKHNREALLQTAKLVLVCDSPQQKSELYADVYNAFFKPYVDTKLVDDMSVQVWVYKRLDKHMETYDIGYDEEERFVNGVLGDVKVLRDLMNAMSVSKDAVFTFVESC